MRHAKGGDKNTVLRIMQTEAEFVIMIFVEADGEMAMLVIIVAPQTDSANPAFVIAPSPQFRMIKIGYVVTQPNLRPLIFDLGIRIRLHGIFSGPRRSGRYLQDTCKILGRS